MTIMEELNKAVPLTDKWSGCYLTDVEKVAIAALILGTTNPEAIQDLTGVKKRTIRWSICMLKETNWDIEATLEMQSGDHIANVAYNREAYPILLRRGAFRCE